MRDPQEMYLYHRVDAKKPLNQPLSPSTPNFIVKRLVESIGIDSTKYGSHSCRKGGCTTALESGADLRLDDGEVMQSRSMQRTRDRQDLL